MVETRQTVYKMSKARRKRIVESSDDEDETPIIKKINAELTNSSDSDFKPKDESTSESSEEESSEEESSEEESSEEEWAEGVTMDEMLVELKKTDKVAYDNLMKVKAQIEEKMPKIVEILKEPLRIKDKAKLVELYEIWSCADPLTEEALELRIRIMSLYKQYKRDFQQYSTYKDADIKKFKLLSHNLKRNHSTPSLKYSILKLNTSLENKQAIYKRYVELKHLEEKDDEYCKLKRWITQAIELPHDNIKEMNVKGKKFTKFMLDMCKKLDKELYGMKSVKEQILLFINSRLSNPKMRGCSLGLIGPPGVGKTTIARCLANALDWPFEQISFGGMTNQDYLKGHDYTYVGSRPGEIVRCLGRMKYKNGILFMDEFEKISDNKDIVSFLLHVTDPQQNHEYQDNYFADIKIDLSKLWFIYSMNCLPDDAALKDRVFTIKVPGYDMKEKINILKDYVLPKTLKNIGLKSKHMTITDDVAKTFISQYDADSKGIRNLEQLAKELVNKINFLVNHQTKKGDLKGFEVITFNVKEKLNYPLAITESIINQLMKVKDDVNPSLSMLYM